MVLWQYSTERTITLEYISGAFCPTSVWPPAPMSDILLFNLWLLSLKPESVVFGRRLPPHSLAVEDDAVEVTVDGKPAEAFVRDCPPNGQMLPSFTINLCILSCYKWLMCRFSCLIAHSACDSVSFLFVRTVVRTVSRPWHEYRLGREFSFILLICY